jgi:hypothetical protein
MICPQSPVDCSVKLDAVEADPDIAGIGVRFTLQEALNVLKI